MRSDLQHNEIILLRRLAKGDPGAFRSIFDRYYPHIFYYVKRKLGEAEKANDITTDCFIKFWKGDQKKFDTLEGVKAYLLRSASNACINAYRDLQAQLSRQRELVNYLQNEQSDLIEEDEHKAAMMRMVLQEIERLPKKCRQIFTMAFFEEKKNKQIAEELNLTEKTVRNQKHRALNLLRLAMLEKKLGICILFLVIQPFH